MQKIWEVYDVVQIYIIIKKLPVVFFLTIYSLRSYILFLQPNRCMLLGLDLFATKYGGYSTGGEVLEENLVD